nr:MAG TPA: hypothetical protein [Crassvirales sp.]
MYYKYFAYNNNYRVQSINSIPYNNYQIAQQIVILISS